MHEKTRLRARFFIGNVPFQGSRPRVMAIAPRALQSMFDNYGSKIYGKYGFVDAFNPQTGWVDTDIIGINAGIILLSAENARTGNIWRWFMQNREIPLAMNRVGLVKSPVRSHRISRFDKISRSIL